jgi:hypothetical protein
MQYPKLELHIAHVERIIAKSRKKFTNKKKELIYANLLLLFNEIKNSKYSQFNSDQLASTKDALEIVFYGVHFLHYEKESHIPKRLIFCLNKVLNDWIPNGTEKYFIVVSYNNNFDDFSIRAYGEARLKAITENIKFLFNVDYTQSLIQISKPKLLANDYLSSIPIYHEMGHFIEKNYQIVIRLLKEKKLEVLKIPPLHFTEFFADLFAAQYIGRSAIAPLDESITISSASHPSNAQRVEIVNAFIEGTGSLQCMSIINELKRVTRLRTGLNLEIRYENLEDDENPFLKLVPVIMPSHEKLHALFNTGWQHWMNPDSIIRKKYPKYEECNKILNGLIRNSIKLTMQQGESRKLKMVGNFIGNLAHKYGIVNN